MACISCGEKPNNTAKDFTKAVIEITNPETLVLLRKVVIPASMGDDVQVPAAIGKYNNVILYYEANKHTYIYSSDGIPTLLEVDIPQELLDRIATLETDVDDLERADIRLQQEIDDLKNSPDVVDIVATYAALQSYDTSKLGDKDVIRVLADETHSGESTYYRWDKHNSVWTFIGTVGDYYTKQQVNTLLDGKQDELTAGDNITIADESGSLTISATDTTYSAFTGTDGSAAGTSGLVPAPATTDAGKFLKADGTWDTAGSAVSVVQDVGTSTTNVMSQYAATMLIYGLGNAAGRYNNEAINIGGNTYLSQYNGTVQIGKSARTNASGQVAFSYTDMRSLGITNRGVFGIGVINTSFGYNNSNYRLISGVYDPQSDHDAATKGYVDTELSYKQDILTAGTGISIVDESGDLVISATGASIATINSADWSALWQ